MLCRSSTRLPARALLHLRRLTRSRSSASAADGGAGPLLYRDLARTFMQIERVKQSRDTSVRLLAARFRDALQRPSSSPSELASALYLTASQLAPPHEGVELRFGTRLFAPVVAQLVTPDSGHSMDASKFPDFGTAVQALIDSGSIAIPEDASGDGAAWPQSGLTVAYVHQELLRLAGEEGSGAVIRKQQRAVELLKQCRSAEEMVFLVRMLAHQSLRIGMGEKSILAALAIASAPSTPAVAPLGASSANTTDSDSDSVVDPSLKLWVESVTKAYAQQPDYAALAKLLHGNTDEEDLMRKVERLDARAAPTVGVPVLTMSAYPVSSVAGVVDRIRKTPGKSATCEYKYDGARVQIHLSFRASSGEEPVVGRIFSRNMEDNTEKYGSLLPVLQRQLCRDCFPGDRELIAEGEVVAVDRATQRFLPFQVLQTKTTTNFCLFVFDLLHLNGEKLIHRSLRERRELLRCHLAEDPGHLEFVKSIDIEVGDGDTDETSSSSLSDASRVRGFLQDAVAAGCEGLMVKTLDGAADSDYKAGARSYSWMKVKQDYLSEDDASFRSRKSGGSERHSGEHGTFLPDTLDLVPIGAFFGKGRRSGVFGSFLLAAYDGASGKFETIGKVGTGFSDAQLNEISERLRQQSPCQADGSVPSNISSAAIRSRHPDVWLSPSEVWEIKATQLTASPSYMCASQPGTESETAESDSAKTRRHSDAAVRSKGLALRFPRFVRFRADKHPEQATDSSQVAELFRQQTASQNGE